MPDRGGAKDSILLIEDDRDIREALSDVLRDAGHEVFCARDGRDALEMLETASVPRPCLILLDWIMHPMSGPEFLRELERRPDLPDLRVLVITGATELGAALSYPGLVGVLRKPFELDDLLAMTRNHCQAEEPKAALG